MYDAELVRVLLTEQQIRNKIDELAEQLSGDFRERCRDSADALVLVGVLKGSIMFLADLARALSIPAQLEFLTLSSYGSAAVSSGKVRLVNDLETDLRRRHVLIVEDVIDSGLTLAWLLQHLEVRKPASLEVCALLRKQTTQKADVPVRYVGFDIPNEFVVGYGIDFAERYRDLPFIATLETDAEPCTPR
ncbi:hypoxanthine phosphoribosyltransferase [Pseudonocardia sp. CA-142604]|uniref:hypoxanthine phosphoribosyltransferase n=1 Tax=Pseudonocardia sp. CA-142604 TaxID=3240024 RepID=UPI003D93CF64